MAFQTRCARQSRPQKGFTLIEALIVVALIAILSAIALPAFSQYLDKSRARAASADLIGMSLNLENAFQKTLAYPVIAQTTTTAGTVTAVPGWAPTQPNVFRYTLVSAASGYTIIATSIQKNCTLTFTSPNTRAVTGDDCGFTSW